MGLTSSGFLAVCVASGLVVIGFALWALTRINGRGPGSLLARLGVLVAAQLAALAMAAVAVNDNFQFYTSLSDVLGTANNADNVVVKGVDPQPPVTGGEGQTGKRYDSVRIRSGILPAATARTSGEILDVTVRGAKSGLSSQAFVYLPPAYFSPAYAHRRMPGLVVMPGYPSTASNLIMRMNYPWAMESQIKHHRARPMVLVMTNETVTPPRDTECTNVAHGPKAETFLAQDLTDAISAKFRVARPGAGWGLMGDSTGGFCAVKLAMNYPHRFTSAVSLSGYYHAIMDFTTGDLFGGNRHLQHMNDPEWMLRHRPAPPVSVLVTTSRTETQVLPDTRKFLSMVKPPMRASSIILPSGGHNFGAWKGEMPPCLDWLSAHLWAVANAGHPATSTGRPLANPPVTRHSAALHQRHHA
ncbi:alpha/beta hydrolase [Actinopolymorpha singaporensis]|uniref:Enterochelin esterase n=1 Tax=Actinopolymorpha singaporensis TaxID=117157 RepID=A0A1H1RQK2_9ACTN|nr:alpha/beta hydrolase-fold protein [Actinopolymorpha singaporensis]SDS37319.1 Enterochelin esterase [Actinopolymorpha singaporensis]